MTVDSQTARGERRKLIEVAPPLDAINAAAAREKSIRHGHPSTLPGEPGIWCIDGELGVPFHVATGVPFSVAISRKRAAEAPAYNGLGQSWPEISRLAATGTERQSGLFDEAPEAES